MKPPLCRLCEREHYSYQDHIFPESKKREADPKPAINGKDAINTVAINAANVPAKRKGVSDVKESCAEPSKGVGAKSGNRRDKADYNAYMKDYMKRYRVKAMVVA